MRSCREVGPCLLVPSPVLRFMRLPLIRISSTFFRLKWSLQFPHQYHKTSLSLHRSTASSEKDFKNFLDDLLKIIFWKMSVRLFSTYFNPQVLVSLPSVTRSSYFPAISSMSFLMLSPSFHLSGCLICTDFHQSSLANPTGFSGYLSMVSIAGKICTGKIALWRDFPAIVTLHFEAYPTDSS